MTKTAFMGGALSFKGDKKKKNKSAKKKQSKIKHSHQHKSNIKDDDDDDDNNKNNLVAKLPMEEELEELTEAERKARSRKLEREKIELAKTAAKSHRDRVEEFNEKLSNLTELNDIPRVSAAGKG